MLSIKPSVDICVKCPSPNVPVLAGKDAGTSAAAVRQVHPLAPQKPWPVPICLPTLPARRALAQLWGARFGRRQVNQQLRCSPSLSSISSLIERASGQVVRIVCGLRHTGLRLLTAVVRRVGRLCLPRLWGCEVSVVDSALRLHWP